jgi:hypothetical protein
LIPIACSKSCNIVKNVGCSYRSFIAKSQNLGLCPSGTRLHITCQDVNFYKSLGMICISQILGYVTDSTSIAAIETFLANYSNAKYMAKRRPQDKRY